ncbi:MAG: SemiSWEET transporter [Candidatus Daviesbacteria bacterium]|nr:SemiSWEET transporter [Candidatus Daviesbacteria bacterium]
MLITILGFMAGALTTIAFLPQIIKTLETKETKDISLGFCLLNFLAATLWMTYGLLIAKLPLIIPNAISMFIGASLLFLKLKYK